LIKIDPYNLELYRFKVGAFLRHSVGLVYLVITVQRLAY